MNKRVQKDFMQAAGMPVPAYYSFPKTGLNHLKNHYQNAKNKVGFPMVIKPANHGLQV